MVDLGSNSQVVGVRMLYLGLGGSGMYDGEFSVEPMTRVILVHKPCMIQPDYAIHSRFNINPNYLTRIEGKNRTKRKMQNYMSSFRLDKRNQPQ